MAPIEPQLWRAMQAPPKTQPPKAKAKPQEPHTRPPCRMPWCLLDVLPNPFPPPLRPPPFERGTPRRHPARTTELPAVQRFSPARRNYPPCRDSAPRGREWASRDSPLRGEGGRVSGELLLLDASSETALSKTLARGGPVQMRGPTKIHLGPTVWPQRMATLKRLHAPCWPFPPFTLVPTNQKHST
jgi:hypothetical protein